MTSFANPSNKLYHCLAENLENAKELVKLLIYYSPSVLADYSEVTTLTRPNESRTTVTFTSSLSVAQLQKFMLLEGTDMHMSAATLCKSTEKFPVYHENHRFGDLENVRVLFIIIFLLFWFALNLTSLYLKETYPGCEDEPYESDEDDLAYEDLDDDEDEVIVRVQPPHGY